MSSEIVTKILKKTIEELNSKKSKKGKKFNNSIQRKKKKDEKDEIIKYNEVKLENTNLH